MRRGGTEKDKLADYMRGAQLGGALARRRRLEKNCALDRERTLGRGGCGKDSVWDPRTEGGGGGGGGLYRVRGKVGGRQTREIGHRLARPLAGLPSPRDLHTMERPQTPFTSDSSLLYYYNCQVKPACLTFYFAGWCHTRSRRNTSKLAFAILTAQVES